MNSNPLGRNLSNSTRSFGNRARNAATAVTTRARGMSTLEIIVLVVILIIVILIIYYWAKSAHAESLRKSRNSPILVNAPRNAYGGYLAKRPQNVPNPVDGLGFTYSMWIYVADWNYNFGQMKNILLKGDSNDGRMAPGLFFYPETNSLHARINTHAPGGTEGCDIADFPLQKWVNLVYILNNRTVDIYIDGKLERSCVLKGVPILNNDPVRICDNPSYWGQISKVQYFNRSIQPYEIAKIYSEGPFQDPRYKVSFFQHGHIASAKEEGNYGNSYDI